MDVLMCVGRRDVSRLFCASLISCLRNFEPLRRIVIVTDARPAVLEALRAAAISDEDRERISVLSDDAVLPAELNALPGWYRQQLIKLHADCICATSFVACLGADTIVCRKVAADKLMSSAAPILYYNRYPDADSPHLDYERRRVAHVAEMLAVEPRRSLPLSDFIMDLMVFDGLRLTALRERLVALHGQNCFERLVPGKCRTYDERVRFGEWTLYAVFILDVLGLEPEIRNSKNRFVAQVHCQSELDSFAFDADVVHFVDKGFDVSHILGRVARANGDELGAWS